MWEVTRANADSPEYHRKLEAGWEPFSVVREEWQEGGRTVMWFRRETAVAGPRITVGMSENGVG